VAFMVRMCGCAVMPMKPFKVSIKMVNPSTPLDSLYRSKKSSGKLARNPLNPPTAHRPAGISRNDIKMIKKPWTKSVYAEATSPPKKLYNRKAATISSTTWLGDTASVPTAYETALPAPFIIVPWLKTK